MGGGDAVSPQQASASSHSPSETWGASLSECVYPYTPGAPLGFRGSGQLVPAASVMDILLVASTGLQIGEGELVTKARDSPGGQSRGLNLGPLLSLVPWGASVVGAVAVPSPHRHPSGARMLCSPGQCSDLGPLACLCVVNPSSTSPRMVPDGRWSRGPEASAASQCLPWGTVPPQLSARLEHREGTS